MKNRFLNWDKNEVKLKYIHRITVVMSNYRVDSVNKQKVEHNVGQEYQHQKEVDNDDVSCRKDQRSHNSNNWCS